MLCDDVQVTNKFFEMGENFNLGDLLKLELHNAVEECREIVDRAQKELVIEKSLRKIEDTWAGLKLSFAPFQVPPYGDWVKGSPAMLQSVCLVHNLQQFLQDVQAAT